MRTQAGLSPMRRLSPQHFALVATLAFTGLRFCHASALREKLVAVSSVHRLVPLESGDAGGDTNAAQKKTGVGYGP
jgi:hypothetical protein